MLGRKPISEEEYQFALSELSRIHQEKEKLEYLCETGSYNAHIQLNSDFLELLIHLKRVNTQIDGELDLYHKQLVSELLLDISSCNVEEKVNLIVQQRLEKENDQYLIAVPSSLEPILDRVVSLVHEREGNQYLIQHITELVDTENQCMKTKRCYEKRLK